MNNVAKLANCSTLNICSVLMSPALTRVLDFVLLVLFFYASKKMCFIGDL